MAESKMELRVALDEAIKERDKLNVVIEYLQGKLIHEKQPASSGETAKVEKTHPPAPAGSELLDSIYEGMFFGKSQAQAAKIVLDLANRRPQKTKVIVDALKKGGAAMGSKNPFANIWSVLKRREKLFILLPKGAGWGLTSWYDDKMIEKYRKEDGKENGKEETATGEEGIGAK